MQILILLILCNITTAGTRRHDRLDSQYLDLAAQIQFEPFGKLITISNGNLVCSGTLIASQFVLSPAHCIDFLSGPSNLGFVVGGQTYQADAIIVHPDWPLGNPNPAPSVDGIDIAIIHLATPVTGITPALRYRGNAELGAIGTFVGYGWTGDGLTGQQSGTGGTKRAGQNVLDALGSFFVGVDDRIIFSDFDNPNDPSDSVMGNATPLDLEFQLANRDSGSGVFIKEAGVWYLAAIGVLVANLNGDGMVSNYGDVSGSTRVTPHLPWIDSVLCPADTIINQQVDVEDLLELLGAWGSCPAPCSSDIDLDGLVDVEDLLALLGQWGACP